LPLIHLGAQGSLGAPPVPGLPQGGAPLLLLPIVTRLPPVPATTAELPLLPVTVLPPPPVVWLPLLFPTMAIVPHATAGSGARARRTRRRMTKGSEDFMPSL
jgi:hypothetical protein